MVVVIVDFQKSGFSAKFNGSSSIELLYKNEYLCFDFRHFAKRQNVSLFMNLIESLENRLNGFEEDRYANTKLIIVVFRQTDVMHQPLTDQQHKDCQRKWTT